MKIMLIHADGYITLSTMAEKLMVSRVTVINDLEKVKGWLKTRKLKVDSHSNKGLRLIGSEEDRRNAIMEIVGASNLTYDKPIYIQFIESSSKTDFFNEASVRFLRKLIIEQEEKHGNYLTDHSFMVLLFYLSYLMFRISNHSHLQRIDGDVKDCSPMAQELSEAIFLKWEIEIRKAEIIFLHQLLKSFRYIEKSTRDEKIIMLQVKTRQFIEHVSQALQMDLNFDYMFYQNLTNHLESIVIQHCHIFDSNEIVQKVVMENPVVKKVVEEQIHIIEGYEFNQNERDFIVLHICAALERLKKKESEFRVILVCGSGIGTAQILQVKLEAKFDFQIVKVTSAHGLKKADCENVDLIISTTPLEICDHIIVSPLLTETDYLIISKAYSERLKKTRTEIQKKIQKKDYKGIDGHDQLVKKEELTAQGLIAALSPTLEMMTNLTCNDREKITAIIESYFLSREKIENPYLFELLPANHIDIDVHCQNWQEAIRASAQTLLKKGYINKGYIDAMIENVIKHGSYIVISEGFAVPHEGFEAGSLKVGMAMIRLAEEVNFNPKGGPEIPVRFVCCMSTVDDKKHLRAFFNLVNMLTNPEFKKGLIKAKSAEEIANHIKDYEMALMINEKNERLEGGKN